MSDPTAEQGGRKPNVHEAKQLERDIYRHADEARLKNEQGEREARAAGKRGTGVSIDRGWVVHPADRGGLKRRSR